MRPGPKSKIFQTPRIFSGPIRRSAFDFLFPTQGVGVIRWHGHDSTEYVSQFAPCGIEERGFFCEGEPS